MHNIMPPRVSCYNTAPSYKGDDAASYTECPHPTAAAAAAVMSPLHSMKRPPELEHYAKYGGTEERTECRLAKVTCAFFQ